MFRNLLFPAETNFHEFAKRLHSGDEAAYEILISRVGDYIIRYVVTMGFAIQDAEEIWSDLKFKLWRTKCKTYDPNKSSLPCWLKTLAHNLAIDRKRTDERASLLALDEARYVKALLHSPDEKYCGQWDWELAEKAINALPKRDRQVVHLRSVQGCTYAEISQITGESEAAVGMHIHRIIQRLRPNVERLNKNGTGSKDREFNASGTERRGAGRTDPAEV